MRRIASSAYRAREPNRVACGSSSQTMILAAVAIEDGCTSHGQLRAGFGQMRLTRPARAVNTVVLLSASPRWRDFLPRHSLRPPSKLCGSRFGPGCIRRHVNSLTPSHQCPCDKRVGHKLNLLVPGGARSQRGTLCGMGLYCARHGTQIKLPTAFHGWT
jgi:hypothetical protein